ncbi:hypothetical protein CETAM_02605 [Corynebacterium comes]|uniref:Uncharacterized protein n=1 Tax=Corynebacterium comes TaxID=2675218 RepID=A0A6B8VUT2_9CORY|nr:hypothetical protein CETAM_02605 [Corynebacterium comes]
MDNDLDTLAMSLYITTDDEPDTRPARWRRAGGPAG